MLSYYPPRLDPPPLLVLLVGQPAATERADDVAAEPLRDAVLVEGVGAGHRPQHLIGAEVLQADGALLP